MVPSRADHSVTFKKFKLQLYKSAHGAKNIQSSHWVTCLAKSFTTDDLSCEMVAILICLEVEYLPLTAWKKEGAQKMIVARLHILILKVNKFPFKTKNGDSVAMWLALVECHEVCVGTYHVLGQTLVHFHNILGNVCHDRNQTLCWVLHVVLQCHILRDLRNMGQFNGSYFPWWAGAECSCRLALATKYTIVTTFNI